jgi:hypothetical protein
MNESDILIGSPAKSDLKVYFSDDPNTEKAGQGLNEAPFIRDVLSQDISNYWAMSPSEQAAFIYLLEHLRPRVAIEIGTRFGGSLQVISKYASKVYSLDVDPTVEQRLSGKFNNVEFIIGSSTVTLPPLIQKLKDEDARLEFVLVDGDHSASGVEADINNILAFMPVNAPLYVIMHDSFNPECRKGLSDAKWKENPHVRAVELDFVPGVVNPSPDYRGQLWGGFALGILLPGKRDSRFDVTGRSQLAFETLSKPSFAHKIRRMIRKFWA